MAENRVLGFERTTGCGKVNTELLGKNITLAGWVDTRRDHGKLIFIDLRDRSGIMQIVFSGAINQESLVAAHQLRSEYVISVTGTVVERAPGTHNKDLPTGDLELQVHSLTILNKAKTLPFSLDEDDVDEELRLKYRYLDLRRPSMLKKISLRHDLILAIRQFLSQEGFFEIETPILTKNTAEGAREFLVPSRHHKGSFYALPQSPQLYKQILMAAGMERYFQIARCFRDEDLRADRQPEFTQLDMEMSFINEWNIQDVIERLLKHLFKKAIGFDVVLPLQRMTYDDAFALYGSDKPDLRLDMTIVDVTPLFTDTQLSFLKAVLDKKGKVGALHVEDRIFTRSELESWVTHAQRNGAKGLLWIRINENGEVESPVAKFLPANFITQAQAFIPALKAGSTLFLIAGPYKEAWPQLGKLRLDLGHALKRIDPMAIKLLWIVDFPLCEFDEKTQKWQSVQHPFTSPVEGWEQQSPEHMKARGYDIVLNGIELGGGSIRIHDPLVQRKVFELIGMQKEEMERDFGFLFEAQELGFPPHGGIALGLDRLVMLLLRCQSIREVIAFPKTQSGADPMMMAPTPVDPIKLRDYNIVLKEEKPKN